MGCFRDAGASHPRFRFCGLEKDALKAVPESLYLGAGTPSGVFLKKTPPFTELCGARKFWNRSRSTGPGSDLPGSQ